MNLTFNFWASSALFFAGGIMFGLFTVSNNYLHLVGVPTFFILGIFFFLKDLKNEREENDRG